jgi:hypothetical protein
MALAGVVVLGVKPNPAKAVAAVTEPLVAPGARRNLLKERSIVAAYLQPWMG